MLTPHREIIQPRQLHRRAGQPVHLRPGVGSKKAQDVLGRAVATTDETAANDGLVSSFVNNNILINRMPMNLAERPYLIHGFYNPNAEFPLGSRRMVVVAGRQVEKSSSLAAKAIALGIFAPSYQTLIVQPRFDQVRVFSQQRFHPMCYDSPNIRKLIDSSCVWQIGSREFINRSFYNFRSCFYSADAVRGLTAHHLAIDEIQDIISDNIPILEFCQAHFPEEERFNTYSGTPKTTNNTLSLLYNESCQFEWIVKCKACNTDNFMDDKIIGPKFYACVKCGRQIDPVLGGKWVAARPSLINECWGIRISQLMVPFMTHRSILRRMNDPNTPRRVFFNECLGLPYDAGQLVLTQSDVRAACEGIGPATPDNIGSYAAHFITAGVDHGVGEYSPTRMSARKRTPSSFTAMAFGAFFPDDVFRIIRIIRFKGAASELSGQPALIDQLARQYNAKWMMSDWGFGAQTNASLLSRFGWARVDDGRSPVLLECQYHGGTTPVAWNQVAFRYMISRNWAVEKIVDAIKCRRVRFFRESDMEEYIGDFTSMFSEFDFTYNRVRYDHTLPDDCLQAAVYCYLAALQHRGALVHTSVPNAYDDVVREGMYDGAYDPGIDY